MGSGVWTAVQKPQNMFFQNESQITSRILSREEEDLLLLEEDLLLPEEEDLLLVEEEGGARKPGKYMTLEHICLLGVALYYRLASW